MKVTKWTKNAAAKLGFAIVEAELTVTTYSGAQFTQPSVEVYEVNEHGELDMEFSVAYLVNDDGSLSYYGTCYNWLNLEDLPATISTDKVLRGSLALHT